jgi:hypothetical protein
MDGLCGIHWGDEKHIKILVTNPQKRRNHLGELAIDGKIVLKWIFGKLGVRMRTSFNWLRVASSGGFL